MYSRPPMKQHEVRPWVLKGQDPIAVLVAGLVLFMTTAQLHTKLGISGEELAQYEAGALILGGLVRYMLERRNDQRIAQEALAMESRAHREGIAKPAPVVRRKGAPGEGAKLEVEPDEESETTAKPAPITDRKPRQG